MRDSICDVHKRHTAWSKCWWPKDRHRFTVIYQQETQNHVECEQLPVRCNHGASTHLFESMLNVYWHLHKWMTCLSKSELVPLETFTKATHKARRIVATLPRHLWRQSIVTNKLHVPRRARYTSVPSKTFQTCLASGWIATTQCLVCCFISASAHRNLSSWSTCLASEKWQLDRIAIAHAPCFRQEATCIRIQA